MKAEIVSRERRRFVIVTGLAAVAASLPLCAAQRGPAVAGSGMLIVSGRLTGADGQALAGAVIAAWPMPGMEDRVGVATDADGRFLFETTVTPGAERPVPMLLQCRAQRAGRYADIRELCFARNESLYRDEAGVWRATFGLTVA